VARAFAATGVRLHLSGHFHVDDLAVFRDGGDGFFNVATPSTVGFPPAIKLLDVAPDRVRLRTIRLDDVPGHDLAAAAYVREAAAAGEPVPAAARAGSHVDFLDRHLVELVARRYVPREWPAEMADSLRDGRLGDVGRLLRLPAPPEADALPARVLAQDWYRLRLAGALARDRVPAERLALYRRWLADLDTAATEPPADRFAALLALLGRFLDRVPTDDVTLDLAALTVTPTA
jgi:hypothetical protein